MPLTKESQNAQIELVDHACPASSLATVETVSCSLTEVVLVSWTLELEVPSFVLRSVLMAELSLLVMKLGWECPPLVFLVRVRTVVDLMLLSVVFRAMHSAVDVYLPRLSFLFVIVGAMLVIVHLHS